MIRLDSGCGAGRDAKSSSNNHREGVLVLLESTEYPARYLAACATRTTQDNGIRK